MTKRALPLRTTRGKPPIYLRELPQHPKREKVQPAHQAQELQRKQMENRMRSQQVLNLKKYPFCRSVHYFFNLDDFHRVPGHLSYVLDESNALKNTFSNDINKLNGFLYGQVLNRKMFGLPVSTRSQIAVKKESRFKNVCCGYLFEIEDKKYQQDKMISTLKVVLSKLKKEASLEEVKKIQILRKDTELFSILTQNMEKQSKIQFVQRRLQLLRNRKDNSYSTWESDDRLYYYHSLNQKLHNQILELKQFLSSQSLLNTIISPQNIQKSKLCYYFTRQACLDMSKIKNNIPCNVIYFRGGIKFLQLASQIVAKRCQSLGQTTYYEVRESVRNLFNLQLSLKPQKNKNYSSYQKSIRKKCQQIRKQSISNHFYQESPDLSRFCKNGVLSFKKKAKITGKEYHLILLFYWLCYGLQYLSPLLSKYTDLLSLIYSDYFVKMYSYLVQVTASAQVGVMCAAIQAISDCFSQPDPLMQLPVQLIFEYQPSLGVGLIFSRMNQEQMKCSQDREGEITPSKKLKRDNY